MSGELQGLRIIVTRTRAHASQFSQMLQARGAQVIEIPTIEIVPLNTPAIHGEFAGLREATDLILTSANAIHSMQAILASMESPPSLDHLRVSAVGPSTARVAREVGLEVSIVPPAEYVAEGLLRSLLEAGVEGRRFFFPRAEDARDVLIEGLEAAGGTVQVVPVYRVEPRSEGLETLRQSLREGVDLVTVASANTARSLDRLAGDALRTELARVPFASIGPVTTEAVLSMGYPLAVEAEPYTLQGLCDAVAAWAQGSSKTPGST